MTTAKIAALQQIQGIQRFFKSPTVKDGILPHTLPNNHPFSLTTSPLPHLSTHPTLYKFYEKHTYHILCNRWNRWIDGFQAGQPISYSNGPYNFRNLR